MGKLYGTWIEMTKFLLNNTHSNWNKKCIFALAVGNCLNFTVPRQLLHCCEKNN